MFRAQAFTPLEGLRFVSSSQFLFASALNQLIPLESFRGWD
jgi:hypothetical protein